MNEPNTQAMTFDSQPVQQDTHAQAPSNSGSMTFDSQPVQQDTHVPTSSQPSTHGASMGAVGPAGSAGDYFHHDPNEPWYSTIGKDIGGAVEGAGMQVMTGVAGAAHIQDKVDRALGGHGVPTQALATMDNLAGKGATHGAAQNFGYGGMSLLQFMLPEGALNEAVNAADVVNAGKTLSIVEKNPRLLLALKEGAKVLAKRAAIAGTVQAGQTLVNTGGDVGEAAKAGLETAGVTGALGGAAGLVGGAASRIGGAAKTAGELAETAASAPDKQTIAENIQGQLQNSKTQLHANYETGINDLTNRLGNNSVEVKDSPVSVRARELLAKPDPDDHDITKQAKELAGDKINKDTRELLESYANGTKPITEDDVAAAKEASKPSGLVDASGKAVAPEKVEPQGQPASPLTAKDLVDQRQAIRAAASKYEPSDINARVLNRLLGGFDDTMDQIASKSGDPTAVNDYQNLRADYKSKIGIYDNPVIKNLMEGKPDDAAKAFISTKSASGLPTAGKTEFNVQQLHTVLGDEGFTRFRNSVFDNMLKTASDDNNGFNPAKFISTWKRVSEGTKADLFGYGDPKVLPQNYATSLVQDAKTAANVQKLTRAGVIGGVGAGAGTVSPVVGAGLSTVLAFIAGGSGEGGVGKGRELIDYVANNPKTWAALRKVGKLSDLTGALESTAPSSRVGKIAKGVAQVGLAAAKVAPQAAVNINQSANQLDDKSKAGYQAAQDALSGGK